MYLALRNLMLDKVRLALSVVSVGLAVMLIVFLLGLRQGVLQGAVLYLQNTPGSVLVVPPGVKSSHSHGQFVSAESLRAVSGAPGVARVIPIQAQQAALELHGRKEVVTLIGYDAALGGGPWSLTRGRQPERPGELVLDRALVQRHGIALGDSIVVKGQALAVVGVSNETSSFSGAYAFVDLRFLEQLTLVQGGATFALVTPAAGVSEGELMTALRTIPGVGAEPKTAVMAADRRIVAKILDQIVWVMVATAFIVGTLVVGMVTYSATLDRRREYGILKAIGAGGAMLYRVVAWQALVAASVGSLLGVAFAFALGRLIADLKPQLIVSIEPSAIVATVGAGLVMALGGALIPARSVASVAPADVFRG